MKNLLLFCAMAAAANLSAQPTITAADIPVAGDALTVRGRDDMYMYEGAAGPNASWDFSSFVASESYTETFVAPSATPFAADFPTATLASYNSPDLYTYYTTSGTGYQTIGTGATGGTGGVYSDPMTVFSYPFTYNSSFTDHFNSTISGPIPVNNDGQVTLEADAYGTLKTPAGTFTDVLRCKRTLNIDVDIFGMILENHTVIYEWYKPGFKLPLMSITHGWIGTPDSGTIVTYLDVSSQNVELIAASTAVNAVPNPTSDYIALPELKKAVDYSITDLTGRVLQKGRLEPGRQIRVTELPEGLYFLMATDRDEKFHAKFQVMH